MPTRRALILEELEKWRAEGIVDQPAYARLRARYEAGGEAGLDEPFAPTGAESRADRSAFAMNALQLVGGLLLGAAAIALTVFLDLREPFNAWAMLALGVAAIAVGTALKLVTRGRFEGLEDAAFAAGLVATAASSFPANVPIIGVLAALFSVGVYVLQRGRGPVVVLAGAAYFAATIQIAGPELFGVSRADALVWWGLVVAFGAILLVFREELWTTVGLGLYVAPMTFSFFPVLDKFGITGSTSAQLAIGAYLAILLALGISLGNRGLVAGAAAGLTIDAVAFAVDIGGALAATLFLLALGGILVWQAEFLRGYFRRRRQRT